MNFENNIIELLEQNAKAKGLTMGKACKLAHIHPNTFSRWRQRRSSPTLFYAQALFDAIERYKGHSNGR